MLRMIFVVIIILIGTFYAILGPFEGLLFYMWNAYFRPDYWTYGTLIMSLNLSLFIGVYVVVRAFVGMRNPRLNFGTALLWLFFAQTVFSTILTEQPQFSWSALDVFARVIIMSYMIVVLVNDRRQYRLIVLVMCVSLGFDMAKQGWGDFYRSPGRSNANPVAFLGDNNGVAMGLLMLMPLFGALIQTTPRLWEKYLLRFMAVGVLLRAISTYSRGGFLGAAALVIIMIVRAEKKFRAIFAVALMSLLVYNTMPQDFWDRMGTINVDEEQRDESAAGRIYFWGVAMRMAAAKPATGVGLGAFNASYPAYNFEGQYTGERSAHSVWFGVLGDLGWPGLILLLANLIMAFWNAWRVHRLSRKHKEMRDLRIYANALISALVVYCVCGTFLSGQYNEMAWHLFALSIALRLIAQDELKVLVTPEEYRLQVA